MRPRGGRRLAHLSFLVYFYFSFSFTNMYSYCQYSMAFWIQRPAWTGRNCATLNVQPAVKGAGYRGTDDGPLKPQRVAHTVHHIDFAMK